MRTMHVAIREFKSVVFTKGFLLAILLPPIMIGVLSFVTFLTAKAGGPKIAGRVAILDHSSVTASFLSNRLSPEYMQSQQDEVAEKTQQLAAETMGGVKMTDAQKADAKARIKDATGKNAVKAQLTAETLPTTTNLDTVKQEIRDSKIKADKNVTDKLPLLAAIVIPEGAVIEKDGKYSAIEVFANTHLDFEVQERIRSAARDAVVDARLQNDTRLKSTGLSGDQLRKIMTRPSADATTITQDGQRASLGPIGMAVTFGIMLLFMMSVMVAGQMLITALVEEKSSRIMEVLLSAVSPMQLMLGKIVGQMAVGMLILVVYGSAGVSGMIAFALMDLLEPIKLLYILLFYFAAFFTVASMMAAIGSAVSDMREAQALLQPVMLITMLPWMAWFAIQRAPNSGLSQGLSFTPLMSPFAMVIRLGGSEPIPTWEVLVALGVSALTAIFMVWAAAKIFRIGVLMYGKPPNFATLIRWIRMA